jgi:hypothetical protein
MDSEGGKEMSKDIFAFMDGHPVVTVILAIIILGSLVEIVRAICKVGV